MEHEYYVVSNNLDALGLLTRLDNGWTIAKTTASGNAVHYILLAPPQVYSSTKLRK